MRLENQMLRENVNDLMQENKKLSQKSVEKPEHALSISQQKTFLNSSLEGPNTEYGGPEDEIENILMSKHHQDDQAKF